MLATYTSFNNHYRINNLYTHVHYEKNIKKS